MDGTNIDRVQRDAFEHCIFPLARVEDVHRDGPNIYVEGRGVELTDQSGRVYLDMMSSHTRANSLGYGNDEIARAVYEQLGRLHYVGTYDNFVEPAVTLAAKIAALAPGRLSQVMYVSGGSEAVEAALKLAKQYQVVSGRKPRAYKVISRWNAYHGATMGALSVTDWLGTRHISEPGVPGTSADPRPDALPQSVRHARRGVRGDSAPTTSSSRSMHEGPDLVAAFIAEPVMQANGVQPPSAELFPAHPRDLRQVRRAPDHRRGDHRLRADRRLVRERALRHRARHHDHGQGDDRRLLPDGRDDRPEGMVEALPVFRHVHTFSGHGGGVAAATANIAICERDGVIARARDNGALLPRRAQGCARRRADRRRRARHRHVARGRLHRRPEDEGAVRRRHGEGGGAAHEGRRRARERDRRSRPSRWRRR